MLNKNILPLFFMLLVTAFPLYLYLDNNPIYPIDEARVCNNTINMLNNGNWMVTYYGGSPERWNTKPPLFNWIQMSCIQIMGVNEISLRFPSAFAAVLTCVLLFFFSAKYFNTSWLGVIWGVVLITMEGYVRPHGTRTGDYDSVLVLFTTSYCLAFYLFVEYENPRFILLGCIAITLATLTKGIAGVLFLPVIALYILIRKKWKLFFTSRASYLGIFIFLFFIGEYYGLRELLNPRYLHAVIRNEFGRYTTTLENNGHDFFFYIRNLFDSHIPILYLLVLPIGIIVGVFNKEKKIARFSWYCLLLIVFHLLVISFSETKLDWYDMPDYPFISAFVCFAIISLIHVISYPGVGTTISILLYIAIGIFFLFPYASIIKKQKAIADPDVFWTEIRIADYLRRCLHGELKMRNYTVVYEGYDPHHLVYSEMFKRKGYVLELNKTNRELHRGDTVLASQVPEKNYIEKNYTFSLMDDFYGTRVYAITKAIRPQ